MGKYLKRNILLAIFLILLGIATLICTVIYSKELTEDNKDMISGMGCGLIFMGVLFILRATRLAKNPKYRDKLEDMANDERLIAINNSAMAHTFKWSIFFECIVDIILVIYTNEVVVTCFSTLIATQLISYIMVYFIMKNQN